MQKIVIGNSDIKTGKLGLGTNKVGGHNLFSGLNDRTGAEVITTALDSGIQMLDTAYMYGLGQSETIIGDVLQQYNRSDIILATKAAQDPNHDLTFNNDPEFLRRAVDQALERLKTDYIDIFYIHFPDDNTPKDKAVAALSELKAQGKIRAIGLSNFTLDQIKEANVNHDIDIVEDHYSLVHRDAEQSLWPYLKAHHITFVPYFPIAQGLLTGRYRQEDQPKFKQYPVAKYQHIMSALEDLKTIANQHAATIAQVVLAWYMTNPDIGVVIPGARDAQQVQDNAKAALLTLTSDEYDDIDRLFQGF